MFARLADCLQFFTSTLVCWCMLQVLTCSLIRFETFPFVPAGSSGSMPEGKDPELDSEVAKKKDPFFKEVDKRT